MEHSSGVVITACDIKLDGRHQGNIVRNESRENEFRRINPQERNTWRSDVRSSMYAASQLPGGSPTDADDAPAC